MHKDCNRNCYTRINDTPFHKVSKNSLFFFLFFIILNVTSHLNYDQSLMIAIEDKQRHSVYIIFILFIKMR